MGLFDIFKSKKKGNAFEIYSPLNGRVISLEEVPDEAFSQKMIGDGCAIDPTEGVLCAPFDGEIDIFETNHAVSIEAENGLEMIVHFGIDTVKLNKEGFTRVGNLGDGKKGDELVAYDLDFIKERVPSTKTPVIITSMDMVEKIEVVATGDVKVGDLLMRVYTK